jgi:hypothetical protein
MRSRQVKKTLERSERLGKCQVWSWKAGHGVPRQAELHPLPMTFLFESRSIYSLALSSHPLSALLNASTGITSIVPNRSACSSKRQLLAPIKTPWRPRHWCLKLLQTRFHPPRLLSPHQSRSPLFQCGCICPAAAGTRAGDPPG